MYKSKIPLYQISARRAGSPKFPSGRGVREGRGVLSANPFQDESNKLAKPPRLSATPPEAGNLDNPSLSDNKFTSI